MKKCRFCGQELKNERGLIIHMSKKHPGEEEKRKRVTKQVVVSIRREELKNIRKEAEKLGCSVSELMRSSYYENQTLKEKVRELEEEKQEREKKSIDVFKVLNEKRDEIVQALDDKQKWDVYKRNALLNVPPEYRSDIETLIEIKRHNEEQGMIEYEEHKNADREFNRLSPNQKKRVRELLDEENITALEAIEEVKNGRNK